MATGTVKKATKPFAVNTGINGVSAVKSGNMVTLVISIPVSDTTGGWKELGVLPEELRPALSTVYFCGYNNNAASYNANVVQDCYVLSSGQLDVYLFSNTLSINVRASVTYPTSH